MSVSRLEYLFHAHINGRSSAHEREELMHLLLQPENDKAFQTLISQMLENSSDEIQMDEKASEELLQGILCQKEDGFKKSKIENSYFFNWKRLVTAAAAILLISISFWVFHSNTGLNSSDPAIASKALAIHPGSNKALLTVSDGSIIQLDSSGHSEISQQGSSAVKRIGALLVYENSSKSKKAAVYNTLTTPRGGQYQIKLPDGTMVWLNSASSIRYPSAFQGKYREVELTGEAYFEVAKNKEKPFLVNLPESKIEVLGTHFNVNAYADESNVKTSLLEGSVKITTANLSSVMEPGQETIFNASNKKLTFTGADVNAAIAWKNGIFQFEDADIAAIMLQISRWYDVEIAFAGKIPNRHFTGKISRSAQLKDVLKILELSNISFTVEEKKITVKQPIDQT